MPSPPDFPAGPPPTEAVRSEAELREHIDALAKAPALLRASVVGLTDDRLDTLYKNWTVRQIVHHIADSHINAYTRFKLALTEDAPTIRPYDEGAWVRLADAKNAPVETPLSLLGALHISWVSLIGATSWDDWSRAYVHPDERRPIPLSLALPLYTWHGRHHTAQIDWLARQNRWR